MPLSVVSKETFRDMCSSLNPRYPVQCYGTMRDKVIPRLYAEIKALVIQEIGDHAHFASTTDGWTPCATQSNVTVTLYFIDIAWSIVSVVLQTK